MEMALAAYRLLVSIAKSDGGIGPDEEQLLARYHRALGLPDHPTTPPEEDPEPDCPLLEETNLWSQATPQQRAHLMKMLARAAWADGEIHRRERRRLQRVADALGVSRMEFASILVAVEDEVHRAGREGAGHRRRTVVLVALGIVVAVGLSLTFGDGGASAGALKRVEQRGRDALVLIQVDYELRAGETSRKRRSTGTGFFVSSTGLIATNKHVLQPWKFDGDAADLVAEGYEPVEASTRIVAFPADANVFDGDGRRVTGEAFDSRRGTLELVAVADDGGGRGKQGNDSADLALLRATCDGEAPFLPLRGGNAPVDTLEEVLVLGFPDGTALLEHGRATPTVARGEVSKVEDTLVIQAPLLSGSSGGPVLDGEGRVVGVATRRMAGASFGRCIQARYVRALARRAGVALRE